MRRGQRKVNVAGSASCISLLLLAFLLVNPLIGGRASALEEVIENSENYDDLVSPQATTISTVNIAFSPTEGSASMAPSATAGASAKLLVKATVSVENSGGYSVYVGSSSANLTRVGGTETIAPISGTKKYGEMTTNTWGYAWARNTDTVADDAQYKAISTAGRGETLYTNASTSIPSETTTYALSFAANIGADKPAGTYRNSVTMSVVSSPLEIVGLTSLANMQDMTTAVCTASKSGDTAQLKDARDGKYYWVGKLTDGKCWMTQNLDLDLSTSKALTPSDSDVTANWTPGYTTATSATSSTITNDRMQARSWNLGNYRITNPTTANDCGYPKNSAANCTSQFTAYLTPTSANADINAHYILGNHYSWNAATAGTGGEIYSGQASDSICPKGWRLPTANDTSIGSLQGLINSGSVGANVAVLTSSPYYFVRGGKVEPNNSWLFARAGDQGYYWSSTPKASSSTTAYYLTFNGASTITPLGDTYARNYGMSVRCIAR